MNHIRQMMGLKNMLIGLYLCVILVSQNSCLCQTVEPNLSQIYDLSNKTDSGRSAGETFSHAVKAPNRTRISRAFLDQLFQKYGSNNTINFEGFEHLLENLGLGNIYIDDHSAKDHVDRSDQKFKQFHTSHEHKQPDSNSSEHHLQQTVQDGHVDHSHQHHADHDDYGHDHTASNNGETHESNTASSQHERKKRENPKSVATPQVTQCLYPDELLKAFGIRRDQSIQPADFLDLCPAIVSQLDVHACPLHRSPSGGLSGNQYRAQNGTEGRSQPSAAKVWGFSTLAVLIISLVGLMCVGVVPILHKVAYNHLQQFLVALAVGSLLGDALLHLIPHALSSGDEEHDHQGSGGGHGHNRSIFIALVALAGIYVFFLTERLMGICARRTKSQHAHAKQKKARTPETKEFLDTTHGNGMPESCELRHTPSLAKRTCTHATMSCEDDMMVVHPGRDVRNMADDMHEEIHGHCDRDDHEHRTHMHMDAHGHSHGHMASGSVASIAWMVIMGDGLHNFCDGIAIGVAFSQSLSGGLSTSIAVFCHELPHELGDFAVLLRAGMTIKQAFMYNMVSSVLCFLGMVLGVVMGNMGQASPWIFSMAAGMFIYIALVAMLPEITRVDPQQGEHPAWHLILQNLGLLTGVAIMLLIALFEDKLHVGDLEV